MIEILLGAFIGGLVLNISPCVLPVISLKVLNFIKLGEGSKAKTIGHSLSYVAGILVTFIGLGLFVVGVKSVGGAIIFGSWALTSVYYNASMACLLTFLGIYQLNGLGIPWLYQRVSTSLKHLFSRILSILPYTANNINSYLRSYTQNPQILCTIESSCIENTEIPTNISNPGHVLTTNNENNRPNLRIKVSLFSRFIGLYSNYADKIRSRLPYLGSFLMGSLTVAIGTACTGPALAIAMANSLMLSNIVILNTFLLAGLGMGSPYLLLCIFPSLVKWVPRGPKFMSWTKKIAGLALILAGLWFGCLLV